MTARLSSGSPRLDGILCGGLLANSTSLIIGLPGSGKTILAQQYLFANATRERPGIYCSTVSESLEKMLGFAQGQAYFDRDALGERVFFEDLSGVLHAGGLPAVLDRLTGLLQERRPGLLVIDSFKALRAYARTEEVFRRFLHGAVERLSAFALSSLWVGEYAAEQLESMPEAAVVDAIIALRTDRLGARDNRALRVLKLRGSAYLTGEHAYEISDRGVDTFHRLADSAEEREQATDSTVALTEAAVVGSGIPGLDELVGGFPAGASILLMGPTGVGKTVLGLHFVLQGLRRGEPGVIATFQENPAQLERTAASFGLTLAHPELSLLYRAPVGVRLDQWASQLLDIVEAAGAKRLLIDGLGDLSAVSWDPGSFREYLYSLLQRLARAGVTAVLTQEIPELFGITSMAGVHSPHVVDFVLLLHYVDRDGLWSRAVRVLKTRGRSHSSAAAFLRISDRGLEVASADD